LARVVWAWTAPAQLGPAPTHGGLDVAEDGRERCAALAGGVAPASRCSIASRPDPVQAPARPGAPRQGESPVQARPAALTP
jgi:hypothetical protein